MTLTISGIITARASSVFFSSFENTGSNETLDEGAGIAGEMEIMVKNKK